MRFRIPMLERFRTLNSSLNIFDCCFVILQIMCIYGFKKYIIFAGMIEITVNDRLGKKVRIKCNPNDTIGDLKKLIAAQTGTRFAGIFNSFFIPFNS